MRGRPSASGAALLAFALLPAGTTGQAPDEKETVKLGVVSFYNPRLTFMRYQPLVDYLNAHTDTRWSLKVSRSYEEMIEELCAGAVAVAHLGPLTYVRAHAQCGAEPLLRAQVGGGATFVSDILVRTDSPYERLEDLAGHRVGFGDPLSTSSHLVPRAMLLDAGLVPGRDVECLYYGQHELAARGVLMGEVEACGVRDAVGEVFLRRGLRRLARSGPVPAYPLAVSPRTSATLRESLAAILMGFPGEPSRRPPGQRWDLQPLGGFTAASDGDYDPVRRMAERVFGAGYLTRAEGELRCR